MGSGTTFGAKYWTDGKIEAPMLPEQPKLRKSQSEEVLFLLDECEEIGELPWYSQGAAEHEWKDLEYAEDPMEEDYLSALRSNLASTSEK